jgi:NTE family protein
MKRKALALSGGGIRALLFHLGVLKYLAEINFLEEITDISSVSGGSLGVGLILSKNNNTWPSSKEYLEKVYQSCINTILSHNIQYKLLEIKIISLKTETDSLFSEILKKEWGIIGNLQDIKSINWMINADSFETAEGFVFSKDYMGAQKLGFAINPNLSISDAIASSAAYPVLIGSHKLDMKQFKWYSNLDNKELKSKPRNVVHLWDGGVFDNIGLQTLYKTKIKYDYIIVSDVAEPMNEREWRNDPITDLLRILDINVQETTMLLIDILNEKYVIDSRGLYIKAGRTVQDIIGNNYIQSTDAKKIVDNTLTPADEKIVYNYPTTLLTPTKEELYKIIRHGYETAKYCW